MTGLLLGTAAAAAQDPPVLERKQEKPATIRAEARLVAIPVVVRDKKGVLLQGLTKADFVLSVDGQPQTIRYFDKDTDLPLTLGLLVDTSMSQRKVLDEEKQASTTFLDTMLTANSTRKDVGGDKADRAFVIQFAHSTELLQDVTDSRPKLQAGLKAIDVSNDSGRQDVPPDDNGGGSGSGRRGSSGGRGGYGHGGGGTTLYDAVFLSSDEIMSKQHGRKALIILSDGDDRGSKEPLTRAIEAAQRADSVIYAIYFKGESGGGGFGGFPGGGSGGGHGGRGGGGGYPGSGGGGGRGGGGGGDQVDGKKVLARMADETGGRLFEVKGKQTVAAIYTEIGDELRTQYRLGYSPTADGAADGYHRLEVSVPGQKNVQVQTRDGYYTGAK